MKKQVILVAFLVNLLPVCLADDPIVDTSYGKIRGIVRQTRPATNIDFFAFQGVPYAKAPIGDLRFKAPQSHDPWGDDVKDCQGQGQTCCQFDGGQNRTIGGEDCLVLNIFTRDLAPGELQPVMFWVHGGSYQAGSGSVSPDYYIENSVILVSVNYRLDVFGFFSVLDENAYGNAGLKDQIFALAWIKENIEHFGGDPNRITIFGESAGSNAVSLLHLSPRTANLFNQIISESSSALSNRHYQRDPLKYSYNLARYFNLNTDNTQEMVAGLQTVSTQDLLWAANQRTITGYDISFGPFPFYPVQEPESDEAVISKPPYEILQNGEFNRVPYIFGHNTNEGTYGLSLFYSSGMSVEDFDTQYERWASASFQNQDSARVIGKLVRDNYMGSDSVTNTEKFTSYLHQELYARANRKELDFLRQYSTGYYYRFSYKGTYTTDLHGTSHGEELQYIFYDGSHEGHQSDADIATSQRMVAMWTNFAKYGNPTPEADPVLQNVIWSPADSGTVNFIDIGNDLVVGQDPDQDEYLFWENLFTSFGVPPLQTY